MQLQAPHSAAEPSPAPVTDTTPDDPSTARAILAIGAAGLLTVVAVLTFARASLWLLVPIHVAVVASLAARVRQVRARQADVTTPLLALIAAAAIGPVGAIGAAAIAALRNADQPSSSLLQAWYQRIALSVAVDPVTRLCDNVSSGRTIDLRADAPPSYETVITQGTTEQRQTVLGIIARRFHPDYLPVLSLALKSAEPVIRVQAAAVAAHLRPDITAMFRQAIERLETASQDPVAALDLLHRLRSLVDSGLLDESSRRQGHAVMERLGDVTLSQLTAVRRVLLHRQSREQSATLERLLIERRRFADLRTCRSGRRSLASRPRARVRRIASTPMREEASA